VLDNGDWHEGLGSAYRLRGYDWLDALTANVVGACLGLPRTKRHKLTTGLVLLVSAI